MKLLDTIKKKGIKGMFLKIPTRPEPRQIEHNMREEFERGRVIRTLSRTRQFLDSLDLDGFSDQGIRAYQLTQEISALIRDIDSYK